MAQSPTTPPNSEDNISKHLSASCNDFTKNFYKVSEGYLCYTYFFAVTII